MYAQVMTWSFFWTRVELYRLIALIRRRRFQSGHSLVCRFWYGSWRYCSQKWNECLCFLAKMGLIAAISRVYSEEVWFRRVDSRRTESHARTRHQVYTVQFHFCILASVSSSSRSEWSKVHRRTLCSQDNTLYVSLQRNTHESLKL